MHEDALAKLAEFVARENGFELGLADEHDLEEFLLVGLEIGKEADYNVFREKLIAAKEKNGKSRPSYAVYDVEFELEGGEGKRSVTS